MDINHIVQMITIARSSDAILSGSQLLKKKNKTEVETKIANAYRRTVMGALILVGLFLISTIITTFLGIGSLSSSGVSRRGTVTEGQVRFVQNEIMYIPLEKLGLDACGLSEGDIVYLYFDSVTDELNEAYPAEYVTKTENRGLAILLGNMIISIVIFIVYTFVICRYTPWGKAWTQYCMLLKQKEPKAHPIITVVAIILAIIICWPQLCSLIENIQDMQEINRQRTLIQEGMEDVNEATTKIRDAMTVINSIMNKE